MTANAIQEQKFGISLPDGSSVDLNTGSEIKYRLLPSGIRMVNLRGEAFFNVLQDAEHPFVIEAGQGSVRVTGTSFSVRNVPGKFRVEVYVESGNVQIYRTNQKDRVLSLNPGETGILDEKGLSRTHHPDPNQLSWKTKKLKFRKTRLEDVAAVLNRTYGEEIRFADQTLEDCLFTGTFDEQPIDSVVRVIQVAFNLELDQSGRAYVFSGNGCN
jgi:ferric-dicitrate binding protein FerR (iron transport regulator)